MRKYIEESVDKYKDDYAFGMPAHKGKKYFDLDIKRDLTEFLDTDNLLNPQGAIKKSQEEVSEIFSSKYSFYIPNGSSGAINIAISSLAKRKDNILVQRNTHKSVMNSIIINDLNPIYINTKYDEENALFLGIELENLKNILEENSIQLAIFVSPNYYGGILKLKEIVRLCHSHNVYVIIDEAHGSHLYFSHMKEFCANFSGADIVINSTHKTIPSLTQTALLHVNNDRVDVDKLKKVINIYTTTSPSYLFLISQEEGIDYMVKEGYKKLEILRKELDKISKDTGIMSYNINDSTIASYDTMKFLFRLPILSGIEIVKKFHLEYNIRLEMGDLYYALAIFSPLTEICELRKFIDVILSLRNGEYKKIAKLKFPTSKRIISPRKAFDSPSIYVDLKDSCGMISANNVAFYPPGIPIISYGERITKEIIDIILNNLNQGIEVVGINQGKIEVVDESICNF
ncbi:aminotransferase class I/II-fold pyridoxal phosphate-dependent enzyme [Peptoniphilus lacrimalis]|uniref:aminotransferase class I/II-fold pyridoxal phosphate-dependent enzyme n=1 Tax=Peptoniphilus lacrimalis TaxID=33031 RepID=UPI0023F80F37|nr:aminotransferase class I/II-fold pyridoxal phosphate-dependent enzyme [Peptoniphilus lacrimalis]MDK7721820.1 aminotransferase class I/II-fold pyridoxal phosphate-dependent enzyme [Peptoniphilus lacrimalis]MDK7731422.1 aminotransferase class I/II-fold pyridoxal phosphate-dependent enzyme [Peptoniphilus lacrimalis]